MFKPEAFTAATLEYTQIGDIIVVAMCILFTFLLRASFVNRTRSYAVFKLMLAMMAIAAYSNMILHVLSDSAKAPGVLLSALRILHYTSLFSNLFLFMIYFTMTMHVDARHSRRYLATGAAGLAGLLIYMVVESTINTGRLHNAQTRAQAWMQVFTVGYLFFACIIVYMAFRYRGRIYRQVSLGVLASSSIAFLLLILQAYHSQSSYTVASFLFPAISLLYLVHANPYDLDIGAVNISGFEDFIKYHRKNVKELLLMSLFLPEYDENGRKYPAELQWTIRQFSSRFFRGAVLFQVTSGRMILAAETAKNPDFEETIRNALGKFDKEHEKFRLDYKIVITTTLTPEQEDGEFNYVNLIQFVEENMPVNSIRRVPEGDIAEYRDYCYIISELGDISAKQNMDDERVQVYCQPVFNLRTGHYDTAEALMRLDLDKVGLVNPTKFIPLAEEYSYISVLSMIILTKTCEQVRQLMDEGFFVRRISVNFSMLDLRDPAFSQNIEETIRKCGIPSEKIAIELTESQNERDFMLVKERISELRESGIKFYLDDFGTGYSNFDRIMQLPFDIIKFDRSLVIASGTDAEKRTMVSYLAQMFSEMHYSVLYEGVETESDQERCAAMYAEYLQGYKFSAPIPITKLRDFFQKAVPVGAAE